jgi:hypothetical protein
LSIAYVDHSENLRATATFAVAKPVADKFSARNAFLSVINLEAIELPRHEDC